MHFAMQKKKKSGCFSQAQQNEFQIAAVKTVTDTQLHIRPYIFSSLGNRHIFSLLLMSPLQWHHAVQLWAEESENIIRLINCNVLLIPLL